MFIVNSTATPGQIGLFLIKQTKASYSKISKKGKPGILLKNTV